MPVHDGARYLRASIESILGQTLHDLELLVLDDGSTDGSAELAASFGDPRIRIDRSPRREGAARARNRGIALARGAYVAILDSDDLAREDRLARQLAFLESHPDCALVGSAWRIVDEAGRDTGRTKRPPGTADRIRARFLFGGCLLNSTTLLRAEVLDELRFREDYEVRDDVDLWIRIAERHPIACLPDCLVRYRDRPDGISKRWFASNRREHEALVSRQLAQMGVRCQAGDVVRHARLRRTAEERFDREFVDWAEAWFERLWLANEESGYYARQALLRELARKWLQVCRRSGRTPVSGLWTRLASPVLARAAGSLLGAPRAPAGAASSTARMRDGR